MDSDLRGVKHPTINILNFVLKIFILLAVFSKDAALQKFQGHMVLNKTNQLLLHKSFPLWISSINVTKTFIFRSVDTFMIQTKFSNKARKANVLRE